VQGRARDAVVEVREGLAGRGGQHERLGRAAAAARSGRPDLTGLDQVVGEHRVEVLADGRRAEPQGVAELGRRAPATLEEELGDPVPGAAVRTGSVRHQAVADRLRVFHNRNVTYFARHPQTRSR
jgi:hypothetical protein